MKEKDIIANAKSIVTDLMDHINNDPYGNVEFLAEELYCTLGLDRSFDYKESDILRKKDWKITKLSPNKAVKVYKNVPMLIEKYGYNEYTITLGTGSNIYSVDFDDLNEITMTSHWFFREIFKEYKAEMKVV